MFKIRQSTETIVIIPIQCAKLIAQLNNLHHAPKHENIWLNEKYDSDLPNEVIKRF